MNFSTADIIEVRETDRVEEDCGHSLTRPPDYGQGGNKDDEGKLRWDLLPLDALQEVVKVYTYGASKYKDRNWERGLSYQRLFAAMMRHTTAFMLGEERDSESGLLHMVHSAFYCLALIRASLQPEVWRGFDDRFEKWRSEERSRNKEVD